MHYIGYAINSKGRRTFIVGRRQLHRPKIIKAGNQVKTITNAIDFLKYLFDIVIVCFTVSSTQDVVWSSSDTLLATVVEDDCPVLLSAPESVLNGTDVIVNVESTTNSVADGKLAMTYDADKLSFVGVDAGEAWTNGDEVVYSVNHTTGEVVFAFACEEAAVRGVLFTLNFTARAEGNATVTDLNMAQTENDSAMSQYINDMSNFWIYYYTLRRYTLYDFITGSDLEIDVNEMVM